MRQKRQGSLLGTRLVANADPGDVITSFKASLASAKREKTLEDDELVKSLFIKVLDMEFYRDVRACQGCSRPVFTALRGPTSAGNSLASAPSFVLELELHNSQFVCY
ncbi:hypothetical protein CYMTET_56889 [Cymbomonas tetramitiformis]|uniref:Uncharacterized protein n=1 Tax=Cymbomonas tetramitiformis TaxID=36881 RepID=A0AAE0BBT2_9CHLO|nr:hypothetical protein CYMTET_56889 [Cymbomonas tetramitiformis]